MRPFLSPRQCLGLLPRKAQEEEENLDKSSNAVQIAQVESAVEALGQSLDLLIEVVGNLKIEDPTQSTQIIDRITGIYATLNQLKAAAKNKKKSLQSVEAKATFTAQMKLLAQTLTNYLDIADEPAKCEEYLTKMMIQMEEMEGKFADFDEFLQALSDKREEVYNAFESKKIALQEAARLYQDFRKYLQQKKQKKASTPP